MKQLTILICGVIILITYAIILGVIPKDNADNSSADLNAEVQNKNDGIHIMNEDSFDWTDCIFGVNGGNGWNFDKPPYKTHKSFAVPASRERIIPYESMSSDDGTIFDVSTHQVNSVVVLCFPNENIGYKKSWVGILK